MNIFPRTQLFFSCSFLAFMLTGCFDDAKATTSETDTTTNTNNLNETPNIVEPTPQIPVIPDASCDPETVNLLDFEV